MISEKIRKEAKKIVSQMTIEQKNKLLQGRDFWYTEGIPEFDLPPIRMSDGPHGLRTQDGTMDNLGFGNSIPAVCFPTAATVANSFDRELLYKMGSALGEECLQEDVAILLGPAVNHKRSPLCGRNFEYMSEDPFLTGRLGAEFVKGVQDRGIGTCLKHFACNSQEKLRMVADSIVDERALFEIYLRQFEYIVKTTQPYSIMPAYNKLNGTYCCENKFLLNDVARKKWGFKGAFISDWGAVSNTINSYVAGLDIEMPGTIRGKDMIRLEAIKNGIITEERLNESAEAIVAMQLQYKEVYKPGYKYDVKEHLKLAQELAENSIVLLKNDDNILPLSKKAKSYGLIGQFAKKPRYQGAGSSLVNPIETDSIFDTFLEEGIRFDYTDGYKEDGSTNKRLIEAAVEVARAKDVVILVVGLAGNYESESFDRNDMSMPKGHLDLINAITEIHPNVVVVLQCGSPISMPWLPQVKGLVHAYLSGCQSGKAITNVLLGNVNPSGKLSESYPITNEDTPCFKYFLRNDKVCEYRESIFTGYRYYDSVEQNVLFPFGYGLSYTKFIYSDLKLSTHSLNEKGKVEVSFKITNVGKVEGKEIAQLYIEALSSKIYRPKQELKEFGKVSLKPNETKEVKFILDFDSFSYYNVDLHDFDVESGEYRIRIGSSSRTILLEDTVKFENSKMHPIPKGNSKLLPYLEKRVRYVPIEEFEKLVPHRIISNEKIKKPFNDNINFIDLSKVSFFWKLVLPIIKKIACMKMDKGSRAMAEICAVETPLRGISVMGECNIYFMEGLLLIVNGKLFKGLHRMRKKIKK